MALESPKEKNSPLDLYLSTWKRIQTIVLPVNYNFAMFVLISAPRKNVILTAQPVYCDN